MRFGEWNDPLREAMPQPGSAVTAWAQGRSMDEINALLESGDAPAEALAFWEARKAWRAEWDAAAKDRPWESGEFSDTIRFFGGPWIDREVFFAHLGHDAASARFGDVQWCERLSTYGDLARAGRMDDCRRVAAAMYSYIDMREQAQRLLVGTLRDARLAMEAAK